MGSLDQEPVNKPLIQDLKVTIKESTLLYPPKKTAENDHGSKKSMFLSNIDQVLNFHVQTVHFFPENPEFSPEAAAARLRAALEKLLVHYDFLAGRLRPTSGTQRLEIECDGSGIGFVVGSTEFSLEEIGDLVYPNPGFMQLIVPGLEKFDDQPLAVFQVTSFKCGGFALGVSTNHVLFDGLSAKTFLENLASQSFPDGRPLAAPPFIDRTLLAARNPPRVPFPHPELLKLKPPIGDEPQNPTAFDSTEADLDFKIFRLSLAEIEALKKRASPARPETKISGFNVVAAHVWRCKALSVDGGGPDRESMVLYAVDLRSRLEPPLPLSYCGNAVLSAYAVAKCSELEGEGSFPRAVERVAEGAKRMTDEYARSAIDWGEVNKGFPNGEFLISSWWKLGFDDVVYPWGKPKYSCPVVYHRKDIILLFPDIGGVVGNNGVNVLVALPGKEMRKFEELFRKFLLA